MNLYTCTAKIVAQPKLLRFNSTTLSKVILGIPNKKKTKPYYIIKAIAKGRTAKEFFDNYNKNDFVILEGFIYMKKMQIELKNKPEQYKFKKYVTMKIHKVYSISSRLR